MIALMPLIWTALFWEPTRCPVPKTPRPYLLLQMPAYTSSSLPDVLTAG